MSIEKDVPCVQKAEVLCKWCEEVTIVEKPDDLRKEVKDGKEMFYLICTNCGREIWFDGNTLPPEFRERVKPKAKSYLELAHENCEKFNKEFDGTFDKL